MKTLIVGGGIGGLTAAIALAGQGHEVTLVEKQPDFSPVGAGIIVAPNAAMTLARLGIDLSGYAHALPCLDVVRADGRLLQRMQTQRLSTRYGPMWASSRPALHGALLSAVPDSVRLVRASTVEHVRQSDGGVDVRMPGGAVDSYDAIVGADGLHSTVRRLVLGPQRVRYSGVTCWRGLCDNPGIARAVESWGAGTRIGAVPLREDRLYYYLVARAPQRAPEPAWPDGFRHAFREHRGELAGLLDALTEAPPLHHDLEELDAPVWGRGRVFLLGDAAHAMTPNQGQGAAMAIEDAYALAVALRPGVTGAVERYVAARHRRVRAIQLTSRRIGTLAHWSNPVARSLRDTLMRSLPRALADAQYHRLVQPTLDLLGAG